MKLCILFLLFNFPALASPRCHIYEIKGRVSRVGDEVQLIVNENTRKENKLKVSPLSLNPFIPYIKLTVTGQFVLKSPVQRGDSVMKALEIKNSVPDPLNQKSHSFIKRLKETPCP